MADLIPPTADRPYVTFRAAGGESPLDVAPELVVDQYKAHGALLLRGFAMDLDGFRRFAEQFCVSSTFNESGGRVVLDSTHNIQSVNRGVAAFPLHPELSREPWKPDACFFGCLTPPADQGATTICDGVALVEALSPPVRAGFEGRRLVYLQPALPEELAYWLGSATPTDAQLAAPPSRSPYFFGRSGGMVVRGFSRPALHRPMFAAGPAFGNFLLFGRYLRGMRDFPVFDDGSTVPDPLLDQVRAVADRLTVPIRWETGDILVLDNTRFMHGRTAVVDPDRRLIASYFGYLRFAEPDPEEPLDPPWRRGPFRPPGPVAAAAS